MRGGLELHAGAALQLGAVDAVAGRAAIAAVKLARSLSAIQALGCSSSSSFAQSS
ncbi:hypothetical protein [Mesorhizobium silamurunense]|uniref:hypothetical protein n=1 Tax=Mesorhizobium silamurunense TaxID=499528 RepID=UPI001FED770A|nr:hypothetical protein [Mesorhizobium silamurunense]